MESSVVVALVGVGGTLAGVGLTHVGHSLAESRRRRDAKATRFHADRRAVYARFLAHLNARRKYASDLNIYWDTPMFEEVRRSAPDEGEWLETAQQIMAEIHLLGDADVIQTATTLLMTNLAAPLIMFAPFAARPTREEVRERAEAGDRIFKDAYRKCLAAMRASLEGPEADLVHVV